MADSPANEDDPTARPLRLANASGYWGDDLTALRRQIEGGPVDVVTMDFLAEITMSILQKQVQRNPDTGYAVDFVDQLDEVMASAMDAGVTIIANAGGVRPLACGEAILARAKERNLDPRVGVVAGDDLMDRIGRWHDEGLDLANMDDGRSFAEIADRVTSANAYLGAAPVVRALEEGARFIVTGRVTDTGITLAPMIHRFGWATDDWDRLAAGIIAGHILECGAQSTGGNFTDWRDVPSFHDVGYPVVEMHADGTFVVTKHPGTGGLVTAATVKEQLVYEMGDPAAYLTPDVVVDFGSIVVTDVGPDRVRVSGIRGSAPTEWLKVSVSYADGYKASGGVIVSGPDAVAKGEMFGEILWGRLPDYEDTLTEFVGASATWGPLSPSQEANEIMARFGVRDHDRSKIREFAKMVPALVLSGPPGVGVIGGRPPVQEVVAYWPCLIPRDRCPASVVVMGGGDRVEAAVPFAGPTGEGRVPPGSTPRIDDGVAIPDPTGETVTTKLRHLAHGRSGDKGDTCNIGVIVRHPALYPWLVEYLTAERVERAFAGIAFGGVERFEVANIGAVNFLLHGCLGGGGTLSLHIDAQGKTYSHALLDLDVEIDRSLAALV